MGRVNKKPVRTRNRFDFVVKLHAIWQVEREGKSIRQTARDVGVDRKSVRLWIKQKPQMLVLIRERISKGKSMHGLYRLQGGGKKPRHFVEEQRLYSWFLKYKVELKNYE